MASENESELTLKENREIILFGILVSLIVLFAGIISGIAYLIVISALVFLGFAFLLGWSIYLQLLETARKDLRKSVPFERKPEKQEFPALITPPPASGRMPVFGQAGGGVTGKSGEERLKDKVNELNFLLNSSKNRSEGM
jgi:hypothetical protein